MTTNPTDDAADRDDLIFALYRADQEVRAFRSRSQVAYRDAKAAMRVMRAPDATLRAMVTEALADVEALRADNERMRADLDALIALLWGA